MSENYIVCGTCSKKRHPFDEHTCTSTEAKRDKCGVRFDLLPGDVLQEVARAMGKGAERYGDFNWQNSRMRGEDGPINHALKHLNLYNAGIPDDDGPDPKIHLSNALCNIMFELYYELHPERYEAQP